MSCTLVTRVAAAGLLVIVSAAAAAAQADERVLYLSIFDEKTRAPVTGLGPGDFVITEDGARREVLRVTAATSPLAVAVLIDNTESARGTIADLRRALAAFFRALDGAGPMALVSVADRPTILQGYTTNQGSLQEAVGRVFAQPGSGATLLDAIVEASRGIQRRDEDRAAIVVVTTENVEFSMRHYRDVLEALGRSGAMLSAVVLASPRDALLSDEARNRASVLDLGPRESGGVRFDVLTSLAYEGRLQDLAAILRNQHRVVYARPRSLIPPTRTAVAAARTGLEAHGAPARKQGR